MLRIWALHFAPPYFHQVCSYCENNLISFFTTLFRLICPSTTSSFSFFFLLCGEFSFFSLKLVVSFWSVYNFSRYALLPFIVSFFVRLIFKAHLYTQYTNTYTQNTLDAMLYEKTKATQLYEIYFFLC